MKKFIKGMTTALALAAIVILLPGAGSLKSDALTSGQARFTCLTVTPSGTLQFGLRGDQEDYTLTVSNPNGTWGGYVSASWIQINGSGTISSGGTQNVIITVTYPTGTGTPFMCGGTKWTGSVNFYGGSCGLVTIPVEYINCPCC